MKNYPKQNQESLPLSNILTNEETHRVIYWAIDAEKKNYARSMSEKGIRPIDIELKIKEIDWEQRINREQVLSAANERKHWAAESEAMRTARIEKERKDYEELKEKQTAVFVFFMIKSFFINNYGEFIYNDSNKEFIKTICFYFSGEPRFENELKYDFRKGLMITGTTGIGKTKVIEAVSGNKLYPVKIASMIEITEHIRSCGEYRAPVNKMLLLDDVGSEEPSIKYFGTDITWFKDFIETYYIENKEYSRLLITTNCGGDEFEKRYGYRVRSRMREMFNVIQVSGEDLRK